MQPTGDLIQQTIPFSSRECQALLEYRVKLPTSPWKAGGNRNVDGEQLRLIVLAIFHTGYEGKRKAYPSYRTIARKAGCSRDTAMRGVKALVRLGILLPPEARYSGRSRSSNDYRINWERLSEFSIEAAPLFWRPPGHPGAGQPGNDQVQRPPAHPDPTSAQGEPTPGGTVPPPQWHGATLTSNELGKETPKQTNVSDTYRQAAARIIRSTSPGNRRFSFEEWEGIQAVMNNILAWVFEGEPERPLDRNDEELLYKLATLAHDGVMPQAWLDSTRRSLSKKRRLNQPVKTPIGYLLGSLTGQAKHEGRDIAKMLKATAFPMEHNITRGGEDAS